MALGRPTEYNPIFIEKAQGYLAECEDDEIERGEDRNVVYKIRVKLPTIEGFARYIGVSKRVLYDWEQKYPDFLHALDEIRTEQLERLINNGLNGDYNSTIAKLMLSSNHGMREKSETDVTSGGDKITFGIAEAIAKKNDIIT
jgi:hypothetical protein